MNKTYKDCLVTWLKRWVHAYQRYTLENQWVKDVLPGSRRRRRWVRTREQAHESHRGWGTGTWSRYIILCTCIHLKFSMIKCFLKIMFYYD